MPQAGALLTWIFLAVGTLRAAEPAERILGRVDGALITVTFASETSRPSCARRAAL